MLILQIALGIVLAVIILALLPQILALGAVVLVLGLGLLLLGAAIFFLAEMPEILVFLLALGIVIGALYGASILVNRVPTKSQRALGKASLAVVESVSAEVQRRSALWIAIYVIGLVALTLLLYTFQRY